MEQIISLSDDEEDDDTVILNVVINANNSSFSPLLNSPSNDVVPTIISLSSDDEEDDVTPVKPPSHKRNRAEVEDEEESPPLLSKKSRMTAELPTDSQQSDMNTTVELDLSQPDSQPLEQQQQQRQRLEQKQPKEKLSVKELDVIEREFKQRAKGKFWKDEICVHLDKRMLQSSVTGNTLQEIISEEINAEQVFADETVKIINSVKWSRKLPHNFCEYLSYCSMCHREDMDRDMKEFYEEYYFVDNPVIHVPIPQYLLIRIPGENVVELIQSNTLRSYLTAVTKECQKQKINYEQYVRMFEGESVSRWMMILLIEGLSVYLKAKQQARYRRVMNASKAKNASQQKQTENTDTEISEKQVEQSLIEVQLEYNCCIYQTKNVQESADFIVGITKNLAEAPYKRQTSVVDFKSGSNTSAMRYIQSSQQQEDDESNTRNNTKKKLTNEEIWCLQLMEIPSISEKIAKTVVKHYPNVQSLLAAYDRVDTKYADEDSKKRTNRKINLLKDIQCEWGVGEGSRMDQRSTRKIGPAASAKIYAAFDVSID